MNQYFSTSKGVVADISSRKCIERAIGQIEREGAIDGLVNAAAMLVPCSFAETTVNSWRDTFDTNVHGTFFSLNVLRRMITRNKGGYRYGRI